MTIDLKDIGNLLTMILSSTVIATIVVSLFERRNKKAAAKKIEADYADQISKTAVALVEPLKAEVARLTGRVNRMEHRLARYSQRIIYLMGGIDQLLRQIGELDRDSRPVWTPNDWDPDGTIEDG